MPTYTKAQYGTGWVAPATPNWRAVEVKTGGNYPWSSASNDAAMIAKYRKGDCRITVVDKANTPIAGASVDVEMQEHAFWWGVMLDYRRVNSPAWPTYDQDIVSMPWNSYVAQNEHKQGIWDKPDPAPAPGAGLNKLIVFEKQEYVDKMKPWRMRRAHTLEYTARDYLIPDPPYGSTKASRRAYWKDVHTPEKLTFLRPYADMWELTNETQDSLVYDKVNTWIHEDPDWLADMVYAKSMSQGLPLYINDDEQPDRIKRIAEHLLNNGVHIDGIGYQSHTPTSPRSFLHSLNSKRNGAVAPWWSMVTESDFNTATSEASSYNLERENLSACFANPGCIAHCNWGTHAPTWDGSVGYWKADGSPTLRRQAFLELVAGDWWTSLTDQTTDGAGSYTFNGFYGGYTATVTHNGVTKEVNFELAQRMPEVVVIF